LITFHKILTGCEAGERESWRTFLAEYTPIAARLAAIYLSSSPEVRMPLWRESLQAFCANNFERLRAFDHQAEREFLAQLRNFLLEQGAARLDPARDITGAPRPTPESVSSLLRGLPLLHQEILFLKLAGYSDATLEKMLRITPTIARQGLERLQADYAVVLKQEQDVCQWPAAWLALLAHARAAQTPDCSPLRQFVRIQDGQTSWYDKDPLEKHMAGCLCCLDRWTTLRELVYWRHEVKPSPGAEIDVLLAALPLTVQAKKKSVFKRMLGS
jgi:hypothetical protein